MPGGPCHNAPLFVLIASRATAVVSFLRSFPDAVALAPFLQGQAVMSAGISHATLVVRDEGEWEILAGGSPQGVGDAPRPFLS